MGTATETTIAAGILFPPFAILIGPVFAAFALSAAPILMVQNALQLRGGEDMSGRCGMDARPMFNDFYRSETGV